MTVTLAPLVLGVPLSTLTAFAGLAALLALLGLATDAGGDGDDGGPFESPDVPDELAGKERVSLSDVHVDGESAPMIDPDPFWVDGYRSFVGEWLATRRRRKKRKKLAKKGYVEWLLLDGTYPAPSFINPDRTGAGVPEYKHDGVTYIFPESAALPSETSGMRCFVHRAGEMDPINLRDPVDHAIAPDQFQEYADMSLQTSSPGWLSDIDFWELVTYLGGGFLVLLVANEAFNLGLV